VWKNVFAATACEAFPAFIESFCHAMHYLTSITKGEIQYLRSILVHCSLHNIVHGGGWMSECEWHEKLGPLLSVAMAAGKWREFKAQLPLDSACMSHSGIIKLINPLQSQLTHWWSHRKPLQVSCFILDSINLPKNSFARPNQQQQHDDDDKLANMWDFVNVWRHKV